MHIEIAKKTVAKSDKELFEFLSDVKNYEQLMPDTIETFAVIDENTFRFILRGMPEIYLRIMEQLPHEKVVLAAPSKKLSFDLTIGIEALDESSSEFEMDFQGKFNTMMAMMIKRPITNFMETLSANLSNLS
ncbi:MAG: SRPBCC family protein [Bacteroidota bacterium]